MRERILYGGGKLPRAEQARKAVEAGMDTDEKAAIEALISGVGGGAPAAGDFAAPLESYRQGHGEGERYSKEYYEKQAAEVA